MSTRKVKAPARFNLPEDVPPLVRAAALALAVARACKTESWNQFSDLVGERDPDTMTLLAGLDVDEADSMLVARFDSVLRRLQVSPLVTVAVCPVCERWVLVGSSAPTRCRVTLRCPGKPVRASIATRVSEKKAQTVASPA